MLKKALKGVLAFGRPQIIGPTFSQLRITPMLNTTVTRSFADYFYMRKLPKRGMITRLPPEQEKEQVQLAEAAWLCQVGKASPCKSQWSFEENPNC